jgi:hypothetical protein
LISKKPKCREYHGKFASGTYEAIIGAKNWSWHVNTKIESGLSQLSILEVEKVVARIIPCLLVFAKVVLGRVPKWRLY